MKFIKPDEISGKILTLLEEASEFAVIVSPYVKISKWYKLIKKLKKLKRRDVRLEFIIRDDNTNLNSFNELTKLDINFRAIPDLHCKLYLNEKKAIFSSMNLLLSSEINSLEIGYETENEQEYLELKEFCSNYLKVQFDSSGLVKLDELLHIRLSELLDKRVRVKKEDGAVKINTGTNNYNCFFWNSNEGNKLRISGILSGNEFEILKNKDLINIDGLSVNVQNGNDTHYDMIWGTSYTNFKSDYLDSISQAESEKIVDYISNFVQSIDNFKKSK